MYIGSCVENAECILTHVWRMKAVYWLLSGECRLYIGSCLENAGCIIFPLEDSGCILAPVCNFLPGPH